MPQKYRRRQSSPTSDMLRGLEPNQRRQSRRVHSPFIRFKVQCTSGAYTGICFFKTPFLIPLLEPVLKLTGRAGIRLNFPPLRYTPLMYYSLLAEVPGVARGILETCTHRLGLLKIIQSIRSSRLSNYS